MTKKKPDFLRDLDTAIMDELTGGGIKGNAAGLVGTLTQIKEIKQLCGLPFCGYMAKLETVRPSGVPDEVTVVFAEDVPYRACNGIEFDVMQEFVEGSRLLLTGKAQTLKDFQSGRLLVYILADFVAVSEKALEQDEAAVRGVIANKPTYRETPRGKRMQHIQENVCTHFGTNMDILQNKFDENTWNAYYEGKIEPFAIQLSLVMTNMSFTERERACGNAIFFSANRLQYASNATKLSVSTQLFDRALLNRNGVMDIWNMAHVEDGEKYYIRKEYTEVSELHKGSEQPVIIQQVPQQTEPAAGEEPQNGQEEKEGVNNAS